MISKDPKAQKQSIVSALEFYGKIDEDKIEAADEAHKAKDQLW